MKNSVQIVDSTAAMIDLMKRFSETLQLEQRFLLTPGSTEIASLTDEKQRLLNQISSIHPDLIKRVINPRESDQEIDVINQIRKLIDGCKEHNRENGALVAQGLKVCRNSISILKGSTQQPRLELYDPQGQTDEKMIKRDFGQA